MTLGLARTPRKVARPLSASGTALAAAGAGLAALARPGGDPDAVADAAVETRHLAHAAVLAAGQMLGGRLDRSDVIAIARAVQDVADAVKAAAAALAAVEVHQPPWPSLMALVRDETREIAGALEAFDARPEKRDAHLDRLLDLRAESRQLVRPARSQMLTTRTDARVAIVGDDALRRLERAMGACQAAGRVVRLVVVKHD